MNDLPYQVRDGDGSLWVHISETDRYRCRKANGGWYLVELTLDDIRDEFGIISTQD